MDKLFDTKRTYIGYDGEEYINMCIPVIDVSEIVGNAVDELGMDYNGRIDNFVWKKVKRDMNMIDMVMYANHIFNPFSVKEGDMLNIPTSGDKLYKSSDEPTLPDGSKHSKNTNGEKSMTYADTVAYLAKKKNGVK